VGHSVAVGAQRHQVRLGIHLSLVLREGLDVVDLDVTVCVILAISLIEVERAYCAGGSVFFFARARFPAFLS
jgi:hypothetical protein